MLPLATCGVGIRSSRTPNCSTRLRSRPAGHRTVCTSWCLPRGRRRRGKWELAFPTPPCSRPVAPSSRRCSNIAGQRTEANEIVSDTGWNCVCGCADRDLADLYQQGQGRQPRIHFQPETNHGSVLMAKKKTEGLLIVEVPDLFAGLDLFEEGWQTAIIGAPDIALAVATEELPELFSAIAEPAPVTHEPIEVSLDSIFGEEETVLLDRAVSPVNPAAAAAASVPVGPAEEKIQSQPPLAAWRERESILEDIGRTERAVVLQRIGRRAVAVTPRDLLTAALLKSYVAFDKLGFA